MTAVAFILFAGLAILLMMSVPVAFALGITSILALIASGEIPLLIVPQRLVAAANSFPLLAIPFFVLTGELMIKSGIARRLVGFADALLGWLYGGLAYVSITASAFFGAISGSALATTAAIGSTMYPEMIKKNYKEGFSSTLQAVGGILGVLIPPSIPLIIYGVLTGTSIGDLFLAVIGAGVITAVLFMVTAYVIIKKQKMDIKPASSTLGKGGETIESPGIFRSFIDAFWGLVTPVIIMGGIYSGVFTPTESAVIATVYVLIIGVFVYKELSIKKILESFVSSGLLSAQIMIIIAAASLFGWILTIENIPQMVATNLINFSENPVVFLLLVIVVYYIAGMFMETTTIILLLVPLFFPVAMLMDIDPVHFGIITITTLAFGLITPPFGASLFIASGITKVSINKIFKEVIPYIGVSIIVVLLIAFIPELSIGILSLFK